MPSIRQDALLLRILKDLNDVRSALRRVVVDLPLFDISNENTPSQLTADQDNYVIGNYDLLRLDSNTAVTITGMTGGIKGRFLRIFNIGAYAITLSNQDAGSIAANRFLFSNGLDAVIPPGSNITLYYDVTTQYWIGGDSNSAGAVYALVKNTNNQSINSASGQQAVDPGTALFDQYSLYDDANNRILFPFAGVFTVYFHVKWAGEAAATGYFRTIYIDARDSGDVLLENIAGTTVQDTAANITEHEMSYTREFSAGDYCKFYADQNSPTASALNITKVIVTAKRVL